MKRLITPECSLDSLKPSKISSTHPSIATTHKNQNVDTEGVYIEHDECTEALSRPSITHFLFSTQPPTCVVVESEISKCCTDKAQAFTRNLDLRTGICFNIGEGHFNKANRLHQERPVRITSILNHLLKVPGLKNRFTLFDEKLPVRRDIETFLNDDDYLRVHLPGYMQRLDRMSNCSCQLKLDREAGQFTSVYFTESSVKEAKNAAISLCRLVSDVVNGDLDNGFAVIRPPGHHAEPGLAGGFCVINNIAVAAAYARKKLGLKKILIVDWDVHHGNGTQKIFLNDPNVLYFSVHRYHNGNYFPHQGSAGPNTVGTGDGAGYTVNVGWNKKGMGDEEYLAVWKTILMPIANEFNPDLVLVSAGFDAATKDVGECNVTPKCFGELTKYLLALADAKVVCALEGGYVKSILGKCVEQVCVSLLEGGNKPYVDEDCNELVNVDCNAADCIRKNHFCALKLLVLF